MHIFILFHRWYRGKVISINQEERTCKVLYLDHGDDSEVPLDSLRPFLSQFINRPCLALECSLAYLDPAGTKFLAFFLFVCFLFPATFVLESARFLSFANDHMFRVTATYNLNLKNGPECCGRFLGENF